MASRPTAVLLDRHCDEPLMRREVAQDEGGIRALIRDASIHGELPVAVEQYGAFGRSVVAVARDMGVGVVHVAPRRFKQVAETYGEDESDAKDAFAIADVSRSRPRNIEPVPERAEVLAEVKVVTSARDEGGARTHAPLQPATRPDSPVVPALEALLSKEKLHNNLGMRQVAKYGGPSGFRRAGRSRASRRAGSLKWCKADGPAKVAEVRDAMSSQAVALPAGQAIERQTRKVAARIIELAAEGKGNKQALRALARRRADVIYALLCNGTFYEARQSAR